MKSKEEVIKEAWGDSKAEYSEKSGWALTYACNGIDDFPQEMHDTFDFEFKEYDIVFYRPKSLQGIENNNGWIKIESESDLPEDKKMFCFVPCNFFDRYFIGWIDRELDEVFFIDFEYYNVKEPNSWLPSQITHYKPIQKPQPPIY